LTVINLSRAGAALVLAMSLGAGPAAQPAAQQASQQGAQPAAPAAAAPAQEPVPGTVTCPAPAPPARLPDRMFIAPVGVLIYPVQATKVADFEKFLGYVRDAIAASTDKTVREQAKGWKFLKMAEAGPNKDVLFWFILDPAVPCVDYAFGPILSAAIPDAAKLSEIWALLKGSVRGGPTLANLVAVEQPADASAGSSTSPAAAKPVVSAPPLDAKPVQLPK
jgi:hypothetical protein